MALVQLAATAEHQVANTMRFVREFAGKGSRLQREYQLDPGKTVIYAPGGGELRVITSSSTGAEGAQATFCVADETEWWTPSNNGDELFSVLDRNAMKRGGRVMETSNAWEPGLESVAEVSWDAFLDQEAGRLRGSSKILYDCIEGPPDVDLADEESLLAALNAVYADCPWVNVQEFAERIWSPTTPASVSRRFMLNQRVSGERKWTTPTAWGTISDPTHVVPDGGEIVAFFDGSRTNDNTALVGCEVDSGHVFEIGVWQPPDGGEIDVEEIDQAVQVMHERWTVLGFFGDVAEFESYTKAVWPDRYADQYLIWAAPQASPPQAIAFDMRSHRKEFAVAAELCCAEIDDKAFTHDGSIMLDRHVINMERRPYQQWTSVGKASAKSPNKIDAGVCMIGARMVRRLLLSSKAWQERNAPKHSGKYWSF